jgi:hypothetical protein
MQKLLKDPAYWRDRAEEVRTIAKQLSDAEARKTMLAVAVDCDRLAEHAAWEAKRSA